MKKGTVGGGIHPYEGKELSMNKPTVQLLPKGDLVYPMSQHIGAPAKPIVAVGDRVLMGQTIAEAGGFVSSPIAASVSGTVKEIRPALTVSGAMANAIVIENDNKYGCYHEIKQKTEFECSGFCMLGCKCKSPLLGMYEVDKKSDDICQNATRYK